jgi:hypothetical protein
MSISINLAALLERFFTERLMQQRQASPHTISSSLGRSDTPAGRLPVRSRWRTCMTRAWSTGCVRM